MNPLHLGRFGSLPSACAAERQAIIKLRPGSRGQDGSQRSWTLVAISSWVSLGFFAAISLASAMTWSCHSFCFFRRVLVLMKPPCAAPLSTRDAMSSLPAVMATAPRLNMSFIRDRPKNAPPRVRRKPPWNRLELLLLSAPAPAEAPTAPSGPSVDGGGWVPGSATLRRDQSDMAVYRDLQLGPRNRNSRRQRHNGCRRERRSLTS